MKLNFTLLSFFLLFFLNAQSQKITGIWRGYFAQNNFGFYEDRYKFEVQIEQKANNAIAGVTYSYKTTVFYGKATLQGVYTKATQNIVLNELKLIELKIGDQSQPCLMTCYLDYDKMGNLETLTGTYTSRNVKDKGDCGNGKVYLEKTTSSDFYKEDFLVKKEAEEKRTAGTVKKRSSTPQSKIKPTPSPNDLARTNSGLKPGAEDNVVNKKVEVIPFAKPEASTIAPAPGKSELTTIKPQIKPLPPKPTIMLRRTNELIKTFYTEAKTIKIELYDNGEIDGDTISVYHNNVLIVSKQRLTDKPITINIKIDENDPHHEFVMVADNLGSIPPNTALMILTAGDQRFETHVTSNEKKNAVVRLEFKSDAR